MWWHDVCAQAITCPTGQAGSGVVLTDLSVGCVVSAGVVGDPVVEQHPPVVADVAAAAVPQ